ATVTRELIATPAYVAPERLAGKPASPRSDLYGVGVMLYEALTGRPPFAGDTALAQLHAVEHGEYTPLRTRRPDLPERVLGTVEQAMARDPRNRFASAAAMAQALYRPTRVSLAPRIGPDTTVEVDANVAARPAGTSPTQTLPRRPVPRLRRRRLRTW